MSAAIALAEETEMKEMLASVGLPVGYYSALAALGLTSVLLMMSDSGGALAQDPPNYLTLQSLFDRAAAVIPAVGVDVWPDDQAPNYAGTMTQMTVFCRLCKRAVPKAEERLLNSIGAGKTDAEKDSARRQKEEAELKNHRETFLQLEQKAERYFNTCLDLEADSETTVKTHQIMKTGRLTLAKLSSCKYGRKQTLFSDGKVFKEDEEHRLVSGNPEDGVSMHRNAFVLRQISQALVSMVVAGCYAIDPIRQHLAGAYGRIRIGTPEEKQLMFDLCSARRVERAFIEMSSVLKPGPLAELFEGRFLSETDRHMRAGHSAASAVMDLLGKAGWMVPEPVQSTIETPPRRAGTSAPRAPGSNTSTNSFGALSAGKDGQLHDSEGKAQAVTLAAYKKEQTQVAHLAKQLADSKRKADRYEAVANRSQRDAGSRGSYNNYNDRNGGGGWNNGGNGGGGGGGGGGERRNN